ncbi:MAG: DNA polymerase III subunit epsilon [Pseudomonadota bacterium]
MTDPHKRQIVLDTETTGLNPDQGHRIIEIGCVEMINRRVTGQTYHVYLNPDRDIDEGAVAVHGLSREFLADKPRFVDVVDAFLEFVDEAELLIHNAPFDIGFLDMELRRLKNPYALMAARCEVTDTLTLARQKHPGQRNSLDALCKRYHIDNSSRTLHGALLDSQLLAEMYLAMTGGQGKLLLNEEADSGGGRTSVPRRAIDRSGLALTVLAASSAERAAHEAKLDQIESVSGEPSVWRRLEPSS